jgi:hypothetical protein
MVFLLTSCGGSSEVELACLATSVTGSQSGLIYNLPQVLNGESATVQANLIIDNGSRTFAVTASCSGTNLTLAEEFIGASCGVGYIYNSAGVFCESDVSIAYFSRNLSLDGLLRVLDLDNSLDLSSSNEFKILINEAEVLTSDVATEIAAGKIEVSSNLETSLKILSENYSFTALDGDKICYELTSESRSHCYIKNKSTESSTSEVVSTSYDADINIDLQNPSTFEALNFRGALNLKPILSLNERKQPVSSLYQEIDFSGLFFDAEFSLEQSKSYRLELDTNGIGKGSSVEVVLYRKSEFDIANIQDGHLKRFKINFSDSSLRRKKVKFDFTVSANQQAEEITVLIYGEDQSYVRNFKISTIAATTSKNLSLFLSGSPFRSIGFTHYVPGQYVPFGIPSAFGYGSFTVSDDAADYEIYTSYEGQFKTTGAHLYEKNDVDHDADLSINFRGVSNSQPGGDSADYLHGTKALDSGLGYTWLDLKNDPATAILVLHTEGGRFALNGGYLKPYTPLGDEVSEGGVDELNSPTRFNNRIGKTLGDRILKVDNLNDPAAPSKDPMDMSNTSLTYFPDLLGRVYVEDDGAGGTQLNSLGNSEGYDLMTEFLFYLYDDQGPVWDAGGPEGAMAGTFLEQILFKDFLDNESLVSGVDADSDGVSNYIEYITGSNPNNAGDFPVLDAYDIFAPGIGTKKAVTFNISKQAVNFGINIYEMLPNGVEKIVWSFSRGRGFESTNIFEIVEDETSFSITIFANGGPMEISDMRFEFN